ncbi:unnamed protein product [Owenia fusiformis]|uniref:PID domain-containing protein n=1 Tax=Owenia fusiformis TaxID=6347 RepID=A0A8S4Q5T9_OWEFU|nr:unnamed protein product [Owenia fusiformis]
MPGKTDHQALAKCKVLYIGSAVPLETVEGLESVQRPLRERYPVNEDEFQGIDAWLTVFSTGVQLQYVDDQSTVVWFPISSLYVCSAVKAVTVINGATRERTAKFVSLDKTDEIGNSPHPPIFAAIMRRTKGVKVLECHGFICQSTQAAMALVAACSYSFEQNGQVESFEDASATEVVDKVFKFIEEDDDDTYYDRDTLRAGSIASSSVVAVKKSRKKGPNDTIRDTRSEIVDRGYFYGGTEHLVGNYQVSREQDQRDIHQFRYMGRPTPAAPPQMRRPPIQTQMVVVPRQQPQMVMAPPQQQPQMVMAPPQQQRQVMMVPQQQSQMVVRGQPPQVTSLRRPVPQTQQVVMAPQRVPTRGRVVMGPPPPPHAMRYRGAPPPPPRIAGVPPGLIPIGPANAPPHLYMNTGVMRNQGGNEGPVVFMPPPPPPPGPMMASRNESNYVITRDAPQRDEQRVEKGGPVFFKSRLPRQPLPDRSPPRQRHRRRSNSSSSSSSSSRERDKSREPRPHGRNSPGIVRRRSGSNDSNERHHAGRPRSPALDYAERKRREEKQRRYEQNRYNGHAQYHQEDVYARVSKPNGAPPPPAPPPPPVPPHLTNGRTQNGKARNGNAHNGKAQNGLYGPDSNASEELYYYKNYKNSRDTDPVEKSQEWVQRNGDTAMNRPRYDTFGMDINKAPNPYAMNSALGPGENRDDLDEDYLPRRRPMESMENNLGFYP